MPPANTPRLDSVTFKLPFVAMPIWLTWPNVYVWLADVVLPLLTVKLTVADDPKSGASVLKLYDGSTNW